MKTKIKQLKKLYHKASKHSNYQVLPSQLVEFFDEDSISVKSRHEQSRLACMLSQTDFNDRRVLDIGGNTGFFTFETLKAGASNLYYFEGNQAHAEFVKLSGNILGYEKRLEVINRYFSFNTADWEKKVDICLLLNVLHHVGDDYGDHKLTIEKAKAEIIKSLYSIASIADTLVFQLGYCWKGDRNKALFENGTKLEMIDFVTKAVSGVWNIESIHIPEIKEGKVVYLPLSKFNNTRQDVLGEFLNRPLFILKKA